MESLEHERANISSSNCNKILIFGEYAFFIMYVQNISVYVSPIISKIYFSVTSHFSTLLNVNSNIYLQILISHELPVHGTLQ